MNATGMITKTMRELDRLKVIQAIVEMGLSRPCRRTSGPDRAAGRTVGDALSRIRSGRPGFRQTWRVTTNCPPARPNMRWH
jgi:hypothetical protein